MQTIGLADSGKRLRIAVGETFALELPETPTSGFRWRLDAVPSPITLATDDFAASAEPGAGGTHRWTFRAVAAGEATLSLALAARTPRATADTRRFAAVVEVV